MAADVYHGGDGDIFLLTSSRRLTMACARIVRGDRERLQRGQQKEWAQQQMGERQARWDQER